MPNQWTTGKPTEEERLKIAVAAAFGKWGASAQMGMAQEECAELIAALNKMERGWSGALLLPKR